MGGNNTSVQQQAAAASDVNVDITNIIDTAPFAAVMEKFGLAVTTSTERTNDILENDVKTRQAQVLLLLQGNVIEAERTQTFKKLGNVLLAGAAIFVIYKGVKK